MTAVEWLEGVGLVIVGYMAGTQFIKIIKNFKQQEK